ncbi:MAG: rhomboid family intramembrane serine protease [Acidiferrobacterales bacterium]
MFIPFRPQLKLTRFPVFTLLVAIACIAIYWNQENNEKEVYFSAAQFCTDDITRTVEYTQKNYIKSGWDCTKVLGHIYLWNHSSKHLDWHLNKIRATGDDEQAQLFEEYFRAFSEQAPRYLTARLWQQIGNWNPLGMISGSFSHASWDHVIGNLFFFVSFSLVVELILGPFLYLFVFLVMALGIGAIDNLANTNLEGTTTLGLSGVVMGMLALAAFFAPKVKINYFYFFFVSFGFWRVPLWAVAIWYISWDIFDNFFSSGWSNTNYVAHLGGALVGFLLGATLFRDKRHWADDLVLDEKSPLQAESWWYRLNIIGTAPVVLYFGLVAYFVAMFLLFNFITSFAVQLFMIAPMVAAGVMIYRSKHSERPDRERYKEALQSLDDFAFPRAVKGLQRLAEGGYTRAQVNLAQMYLEGHGVVKLINKAVDWYRKAAVSGNRDGQYGLGLLLADGRAVRLTEFEEVGWFEKAARQGLPAASMALGHFYERGKTGEVAKDKAADWYYQAGNDYLKLGLFEDANVALQQLQNIAPDDERADTLAATLRYPPTASDS